MKDSKFRIVYVDWSNFKVKSESFTGGSYDEARTYAANRVFHSNDHIKGARVEVVKW